MANNKVKTINLTEEFQPEALEIVNILMEAEGRPATNMAERLIVEAGKEKAEQIKAKRIKPSKSKG